MAIRDIRYSFPDDPNNNTYPWGKVEAKDDESYGLQSTLVQEAFSHPRLTSMNLSYSDGSSVEFFATEEESST